MRIIHVTRGIRWCGELTKTLLFFWLAHPQETPAVFTFIRNKTFEFPRFLNRNVMTESQTKSYESLLKEVQGLYSRYGKQFDPSNGKSYSVLQLRLSDKHQILYFIVRSLRPKIVVETGVAAGTSTGYILQAMKDNNQGNLYSLDLPFQWYIYGNHILHLDSLPAGRMPGYLVPESLKKRWHLILGNTYDKLPVLLKSLGSIDIFLHDSEHSYKTMTFEYENSWPIISKRGFLLSDDTDFTDAFIDFAKKVKKKHLIFMKIGILQK